MPDDLAAFDAALRQLPAGTFTGTAKERRYIVTKSTFNGGRSVKLVAEELGGSDYISLNLYRLKDAPRLFPCEMSRAKVMDFVRALHPDQDGG